MIEQRFEEYLKLRQEIKALKYDITNYDRQFNNSTDIKQMKYKLKKLRENHIRKSKDIREKIKTLKERQGLVLDILRVEMLEAGQNEIVDKTTNVKIKLVQLLKIVLNGRKESAKY